MLDECLQEFSNYANPESGSYPWIYQHNGGLYDFELLITAIIHGNEYGSLPGIIELITDLEEKHIKYGGKLTILLGNPEAARENVRFLESDLNRMFLNNPLQTHEAERARTLMPFMDRADLLIDFHQTILDTQRPFYICPLTDEVLHWAKVLSCSDAIIDSTPDESTEVKTRCADDYMFIQNKPALTIELSQKGFNEHAKQITLHSCKSVMACIDRLQKGETLKEISCEYRNVQIYETIHREPYRSREYQLRPNIVNFMPVKKGEKLNVENSPELLSPVDGFILFPKYPPPNKALPFEIYRIIRPK